MRYARPRASSIAPDTVCQIESQLIQFIRRDYASNFLRICFAVPCEEYEINPLLAESGATRTPIPAQGGQHSGDYGQRVMAA